MTVKLVNYQVMFRLHMYECSITSNNYVAIGTQTIIVITTACVIVMLLIVMIILVINLLPQKR